MTKSKIGIIKTLIQMLLRDFGEIGWSLAKGITGINLGFETFLRHIRKYFDKHAPLKKTK